MHAGAGVTFELNRAGGAEVLKTIVADEIAKLTEQIAAAAGEGAAADHYVTDRAAGSVSVPAGLQAKRGVLTRAAASVGLEVRPQ